ncbi:MAG: hypothetical protein ABH919_02940, partial [bacterium]
KFTLPDLSEKKRPVAGHDRQKIKTFHGVIFHDATEMISVSWLFDLTRFPILGHYHFRITAFLLI